MIQLVDNQSINQYFSLGIHSEASACNSQEVWKYNCTMSDILFESTDTFEQVMIQYICKMLYIFFFK